ncbi:MAG: PilW family protein [Candidatus Zhuqueibacterota bacterium]
MTCIEQSRQRNEAGFTLIELMNVMVISSIIAIGAGIILVSSYRFFEKATQKAVLQQEMNFAFELIGKRIRESDLSRYAIYTQYGGIISGSGSCIYVEYSATEGYYIYKQSSSLLVKKKTETAQVLLTDMVSGLTFSNSSNVIQVSMTGYLGGYTLSNSCQYRFRN